MKRIVLIAAIGVLAVAAGPLYGAVKKLDQGKFSLFNAIYNSATIQRSQTTVFLEKRVFRINEKTGETWMLIDNIRDGRDVKYWQKIKEGFDAAPNTE